MMYGDVNAINSGGWEDHVKHTQDAAQYSGSMPYSMVKIQRNFKDFKDLNLQFSSTKIIDKKPYTRCSASKFRLQCDTEFLLNKQANYKHTLASKL